MPGPEHTHYYEVEGATPLEMGRAIGETLYEVTHHWIDRRFSDPNFGIEIDKATAYLNLTERFFPEYIQELLGQAQGLHLSLSEMWALSLEEELHYLDSPSEKCSTVVTNKGLLLGHTEDEDPGTTDSLVILKKESPTLTSLEFFFLGTLGGTSVTISSHGIASSRNVLADFNTQFGIPRGTVARFLSETDDPQRALVELTRMPRRMGSSLLFITQEGEVTTAETTAEHVVETTSPLPYVHTNHYLSPELTSYDFTQNQTSTYERYEVAKALAKPEMTPQEMMALLNDTSRGPQKSVFNERTIGRAVVDWSTRSVWFWLKREKEQGWVKYDIDFVRALQGSKK